MAKFIIDGDNKGLIEKSKQSEQALGKVGTAADKAGKDSSTSFLKMAASIATGTLAAHALTRVLGGIKSQFLDVINKAGTQEQMTMRLAFAVSKLGVSWRAVRKEIDQYTANVQYKTGIGDDRQQDMLARLMMITGDYKKSLQLLVPTIGLAIESNRGFEETALAVGRAVAGFKDILGRYGVVIDEDLYKQDAFAAVMKKIGPSADAATIALNTYAGKVAQLNEYIGDIKENVGLPIIERFTALLKGISQNDFENVLSGATKFGEKLGEGVEYMLAGLQTAQQIIGGIEFKDMFKDAFGNIQKAEFWQYIGETMKVALYNNSIKAFDMLGQYLATAIPEMLGGPIRMAMSTSLGTFSNLMKGAGFIDFGTGKIAEQLAAIQGEKSAMSGQPMQYPSAPEFLSSVAAAGAGIGNYADEMFPVNLANIRSRTRAAKRQQDDTFSGIAARNRQQQIESQVTPEEQIENQYQEFKAATIQKAQQKFMQDKFNQRLQVDIRLDPSLRHLGFSAMSAEAR